MNLPKSPDTAPVDYLTPSLYIAALRCRALAAWYRFAPKDALPSSPSAVLGSAFHAVAEAAVRGRLPVADDERRTAARRLFEAEAGRILAESHPLLRRRFDAPAALPYYRLSQARAAQAAVALPRSACGAAPGEHEGRIAEKALQSRDGSVRGRIDLIDPATCTVYDYKSGAEPEEGVTPNEKRQLRLYAYLCAENGIAIERGVIVRGSGRRDELAISSAEAFEEAAAAEAVRTAFNRAAVSGFAALAAPSAATCAGCPCIPVCDGFWSESAPDWAEAVGCQAEAKVESVARQQVGGVELMRLGLRVVGGTVPPGPAGTDALPSWISDPAGDDPMSPGETIRIVGAEASPPLLRMARNGGTAVWKLLAGSVASNIPGGR